MQEDPQEALRQAQEEIADLVVKEQVLDIADLQALANYIGE